VLGNYDNTLVVGSLSKGLSCFGGFIACNPEIKFALKVRSGPMVFGGPVPPPYLEAICSVMDIMESDEGLMLLSTLHENMGLFNRLANGAGLSPKGGIGAIASIPIGDETATLTAGKLLFERGFYVQSVIFPAVPHHQGILRVQINAIHTHQEIRKLVEALADVVAEVGTNGEELPEANLESNGVTSI
jgi:7-keto-8-aminopelargonate synthetase-like enzyme